MSASLSGRRGGSCLVVLIVVALVAVLVTVVMRMNALEREKAEREQAERQKAAVKSPEQLQRERINEALSDGAPDLGPDPTRQLVDGSVASMKRTRDACIRQQQVVSTRLSTAENEIQRISGELKTLQKRKEELLAEARQHPDDQEVIDALGDCLDEIGEGAEGEAEVQQGKKYELAKVKADAQTLREYAERLKQEVSSLSKAIRSCESDGRVVATATEFKELKTALADAAGQKAAIGSLRRNLDGEVMGVGAENAGVRNRKRERAQKLLQQTTSKE